VAQRKKQIPPLRYGMTKYCNRERYSYLL
jgi:hypothetical protein